MKKLNTSNFLVRDHSNEIYGAVLSYGFVYHAALAGSNFSVCEWNPDMWSVIQENAIEQCLHLLPFILYDVRTS